MIAFKHVSAGYGKKPVLGEISFTARSGSLTVLLGPNGCGKTTLLRTAVRQLTLTGGNIEVNGKDIRTYGRKEFARMVSFVPQNTGMPDMTVQTLVSHGRFPYLGMSRIMRQQDQAAVEEAMREMGIEDWRDRNLRSLSGGERQLAYLAMALAQETSVLLLDEPTAFLDVHKRFLLMEKLRLLTEKNKTVVSVLHDLPCALQYGDYLVLLNNGRLLEAGTPDELFKSGKINQLFGTEIVRSADRIYYLKNPDLQRAEESR
jgi:ABC-type cobalamin/Fe3+-siderophores transport system ATPase subunit